MRTRITLTICLCLLLAGRASAQWAVIDPSNIAQSIVNTHPSDLLRVTSLMHLRIAEIINRLELDADYINGGKLIRMPVKDIRIAGRNTMGVIMFRLNDSEHVVSATCIED